MRVDFPRWEDREPTGLLSHAERYFRYHRTPEASMVDLAAIHLEGDTIQWYNGFEHTQGVPTWSHDQRRKKGRLLLIEPTNESEQEEEDLEHKKENTEEDLQPADCMATTTCGEAVCSQGLWRSCLPTKGCLRVRAMPIGGCLPIEATLVGMTLVGRLLVGRVGTHLLMRPLAGKAPTQGDAALAIAYRKGGGRLREGDDHKELQSL
ncbi:hypothetical protein BHE74_00030599 [Ensete ventricosum]|nr:hypothetical protein BHE74_00030599 [Ensete ventricosum]